MTHSAGPSTKWTYRLEPAATGGTELVESFEMLDDPSKLMTFVEKKVMRIPDRKADLEQGMRRRCERIKAVADSTLTRPDLTKHRAYDEAIASVLASWARWVVSVELRVDMRDGEDEERGCSFRFATCRWVRRTVCCRRVSFSSLRCCASCSTNETVNHPARPSGRRTFLEGMLAEAANWDADRTPLSLADVLARPDFAHYVQDWPRADDIGVVAGMGTANRSAQRGADTSRNTIPATGSSTRLSLR